MRKSPLKQPATSESAENSPDASDTPKYLNREISWLDFNHRVLELAQDKSLPLLETRDTWPSSPPISTSSS